MCYNMFMLFLTDLFFMVGFGLSFVLLTMDSKTICRTKVCDVPNTIKVYVTVNFFQLLILASEYYFIY